MPDQPPQDEHETVGVRFVKIATTIAVFCFVMVFLTTPTGITIPWSWYLGTFGPVFIIAVVALIGFVVIKVRGRMLSIVYGFVSFSTILGVLYATWFVYRLRWHPVLS